MLRTPRPCATTRRPPRRPRRSTTSVWRRSRSSPTSTAPSVPRWSAPTTSSRSSRPCAPTPSCTSAAGEELVEASEIAMQRAWDAMPEWFEVLPQARCAVQPTMTGAKAFYFPPAGDGSRGGTFFVNVADPTSWGTFELRVDGLPRGHPRTPPPARHRQRARAACRSSASTSTTRRTPEGWGLYTERLSDEMGLYSSAVDRMGMFAADSMRACRLVVDTGLHALGWSREQAVEYMVANSPLAEGVVRPEIDRYVVSPGQATSYMVGRLEIQRMRAEAEAAPGECLRGEEVPQGRARLRVPSARGARRRGAGRGSP